jgi:hypothetical protein
MMSLLIPGKKHYQFQNQNIIKEYLRVGSLEYKQQTTVAKIAYIRQVQ